MRDTEKQKHRQGKKQAPYREPDVGLDLSLPISLSLMKADIGRPPGSCPKLKADPQPLNHPGIPRT